MKRLIGASVVMAILFMACNKKEPSPAAPTPVAVGASEAPICSKSWIAEQPVKVGETGILLPVGTKICVSDDQLEVKVELPKDYAFLTPQLSLTEKTLPVFGTYACYCSQQGPPCTVFYANGMGFGCLQSSCTGSCTGKFTYQGYSIDRVINLADKSSFFNSTDIQQQIRQLTQDVSPLEPYGKFSVRGIHFFLVQDEKAFLSRAACNCEGTQACKLKTLLLPLLKGESTAKKIYYCDGGCNGCELTVS